MPLKQKENTKQKPVKMCLLLQEFLRGPLLYFYGESTWEACIKTLNFSGKKAHQMQKKSFFSSLPGFSMSSVSGCRLNGSVLLFSKCLMMTLLSITCPLGRSTGSVIRVSINGSLNSSGASANQSSDFWLLIKIW